MYFAYRVAIPLAIALLAIIAERRTCIDNKGYGGSGADAANGRLMANQ
jgi:hypothetical protein